MLLMANHKEATFSIRGNIITVKRGQIGRSESSLAGKWHWSRNKLRSFIRMLKTEQQIEQQKSFILNIITIINYEKYQKEVQQKVQQKDSRRYTNNNDNNVNNKEIIHFSPAPAEKPLRRENGKHRFEDSHYYDPNEFRANLDWPPDVCDYWFDVLVNASAANSNLRYNDWLCVAKQWKLREERGKR